jgi:beta-glucosidase
MATETMRATEPPLALPEGFVIGTASSAFQIEGAHRRDGRAPSIWDAFPYDAAGCEHYSRRDEDLDLLGALGVDAYRFSLAWPRLMPAGGGGRLNPRGVEFYERLVNGLRERGIAPIACLYHWDLPQSLQERGGWGARDTAARFAEYAAAVAERLSDGVAAWVTLNEPFMHLLRGHIVGDHAPGLTLEDWSAVVHHLLLAHGWAAQALRATSDAPVGLVENVAPVRPATSDPRDQPVAFIFDLLRNQLTLGAVLAGAYPELLLARRPTLAAAARDDDMAAISTPLDFLGVNFYGPAGVRAAPEGQMPPWQLTELEGLPRTEGGSTIDPGALTDALVMLGERYPRTLPPLLVTEFGRDCPDALDENGECDDTPRIDFVRAHLDAIVAAIARGADVRGGFVWSLLDSFEWDHGFGPRYGLVHVDFESGARTPKRSFAWLAAELAGRRRGPGRPADLAALLKR